MQTDLPIAKVLFSADRVGLYFIPEGEERRKRHEAMELPRDPALGETDLNVRYLRAIERAANYARENALAERLGA